MKTEHYHKLLTEQSSAERRAPGDPSIILNSICSHFRRFSLSQGDPSLCSQFRREIRLFALTSTGRWVSLLSLLRGDGFLCSHFYGEMGFFALTSTGRWVSLLSLLRGDGFLCYGYFCFCFFAVSSAPVLGNRPEAEQVEASPGVAMGAVSEMRSETRAGTD